MRCLPPRMEAWRQRTTREAPSIHCRNGGKEMTASSFNFTTPTTLLGMHPGFTSVRDRRDDRGGQSRRKREELPARSAIRLDLPWIEDTKAELLAPEMVQPSLTLVGQVVRTYPDLAQSTHKPRFTRHYLGHDPLNENGENIDE